MGSRVTSDQKPLLDQDGLKMEMAGGEYRYYPWTCFASYETTSERITLVINSALREHLSRQAFADSDWNDVLELVKSNVAQ